jgi:hypothetical protein
VWQLLGVEKIQNGGHCHGNQGAEGSLMAPNSKNYDGYQFTRTKSTWKPNFSHIG